MADFKPQRTTSLDPKKASLWVIEEIKILKERLNTFENSIQFMVQTMELIESKITDMESGFALLEDLEHSGKNRLATRIETLETLMESCAVVLLNSSNVEYRAEGMNMRMASAMTSMKPEEEEEEEEEEFE